MQIVFYRLWVRVIRSRAKTGELVPSENPEILDIMISTLKRSVRLKKVLQQASASSSARQNAERERATNLARKYMLRYFTQNDHLDDLLGQVLDDNVSAERPVFYN